MNTRILTEHLPEELADKLDALASRLDRPRGRIVSQALIAWFEAEEERDRLTIEALADVEAGRILEHETIRRWADGLGRTNETFPKT